MALDLTGSREHSLREARIATAAMFDTIKSLGAVAVKLVYFRGGILLGQGECRASGWHNNPDILSREMQRLSCKTGYTQIARVLRLVLAEKEVAGVVLIGDHCEDEPGELQELARVLGRKSIPLFVFHECADHDGRSLEARPVFEDMAEASAGVYVEFKPDSAGAVLKEILANVAAFAAGGAKAVKQMAQPVTAEARHLQARLLLGPASDKGR